MMQSSGRDFAGSGDVKWSGSPGAILPAAGLSEVTEGLSSFADACIEQSLSFIYQWQCSQYGVPAAADGSRQSLVVIGMGKLGGCELNFSSDVDLIFAYPEPGKTKGCLPSLNNEEFFVRLCRRLVRVIGDNTSDGIVFRVDTRLRPYGESGPLVMNFDAMDSYYQRQGREWERYAWIKARVVAGDREAGGILLKRLKPFVYRRYLDFGAFESLRDMKQKITLEIQRKGIKDDIKIGPGGIREVEFFGQVFQLIRGGVVPILQERRILKVLEDLDRESHISPAVRDELTEAYVFLRSLEHRLQEFMDQQTHKLPVDPAERVRLAASMGYATWDAFAVQLGRHRETVHFHFSGLLAQTDSGDKDTPDDLAGVWQGLTDSDQNNAVLGSAGFESPDEIVRILNRFRNDLGGRVLNREVRERIDKLIPLVLRNVSFSEQPITALNRIMELIRAFEGRACYIALLLENPTALTHLVKLTTISRWVVSFLSRHPVLLDELLDPRILYAPSEKADLEKELHQRIERLPPEDLEYQIEELCIFKQTNTLRMAASDVTGGLPLMRVSDHLSYIAETVLSEVFELSWRHLVEKHGKPSCRLEGGICDRGFAIVAYGKLGGIELGYGSDLDLVFLHAGTPGKTQGGHRPIDNGQFFARLGQRIIHILNTHTAAGVLYEIDMRLRPSGSSGILVSHIDAFNDYMVQKAWTWEHQALIRARAICGDSHLAERFEQIRKKVIALPREHDRLREEIGNMRKRMRRELLKPEPSMFDLKQDPGGIVDIEFLVQHLILLNAHGDEKLTRWTDNVRLIQTLAETGIIDNDAANLLKTAYLAYRSAVHRLSLQEKPEKVPEEQFAEIREKVKALWNRFIEI